MKIAIDISQIVYGTGVSTYTKNLVNNLLKIDSQDEYILFAGSLRRKGEILSLYPSAKVFPIPPTLANVIWNRLHVFPIENLIGKVDVFHSSDWAEPPSSAFKVTTVHDLAPFLYSNLFPRDIIRNIVDTHKYKLAWVKDESKRIIVPTTATKNDLTRLGFRNEIIRVIPEAISPDFKKMTEEKVRLILRKHKIYGDYVISVGLDPRKNTERIIKAFERSSTGKDLKLILVGVPKYMRVKPSRNLRILGGVSTEDLIGLYSGAKALIYPSLYEGFGLPILEAMACETPVVTSNISSMAEVAGEAAELVDPYQVDSISEGIEKVLRGPRGFIDKGLKHVKDFSWEKTAKMTLDVYKEAKI
ncbi:MAG: glycosyltransferase family 1 protein [Candidatus Microgenomates bacterium]|jgi:glycosyltransferase involved in cell wall biosynthesis